MKARKRVIQGGTSAGKTYAVIPILIDMALKKERLKITIVAETLPAVKEGALDIFKSVMEDTGRWIDSNWNASTLTYTFGNRTRIQFKSFDTEGKAKASGKRDILFLNEANHIPFHIADALMIRSKETYIDFNPDNEFWVHTETLQEPNSEFLLLTYEDNEALSPETLEDLLIKKKKAETSEYWANWWRVYGMGLVGNLQGVVFDSWQKVDSIPQQAILKGYGMDFGFTNDPTTLIAIYEHDGIDYWDEVVYQTQLLTSDLSKLMTAKQVRKQSLIVADSAEPKTISELNRAGWNVKGAEKGKDSIIFGIQQIQEKQIKVTSRSLNLIRELRSYIWEKDRDGNTLNKPIDAFNHAIDAIRYFYLSQAKPKSKAPKARYV